MRLTLKSAALLLGLAAIPAAAGGAFAETKNWARDFVRQREAAVVERAIGARSGKPDIGPPLIVGGRRAPEGRWPFQVALLLASIPSNSDAQFCGGSIVDEQFILTAAHCANVVAAHKLHILTGTQSLARGGVRRAVKGIRIHPKFDNRTFDYDIAIVQLETKISGLTPNKIAKIITRADQPRFVSKGMPSFVAGWGDTGSGFPTALREVSVPIVPQMICNGPKSYDGEITPRMLCAGLEKGGKDSCQGDSGGPLLVKDAAGRLLLQAGIVSWGEGCALPRFYGVYTRLAALEPWVTAKINALRASAAAASACASSGNRPGSPACRRAANEEAEHEMAAYLDLIKREGTAAQAQGAAVAQGAWSRSLARLCAFEAATGGQLAQESCVMKETRNRADALAGQLSDLGN